MRTQKIFIGRNQSWDDVWIRINGLDYSLGSIAEDSDPVPTELFIGSEPILNTYGYYEGRGRTAVTHTPAERQQYAIPETNYIAHLTNIDIQARTCSVSKINEFGAI